MSKRRMFSTAIVLLIAVLIGVNAYFIKLYYDTKSFYEEKIFRKELSDLALGLRIAAEGISSIWYGGEELVVDKEKEAETYSYILVNIYYSRTILSITRGPMVSKDNELYNVLLKTYNLRSSLEEFLGKLYNELIANHSQILRYIIENKDCFKELSNELRDITVMYMKYLNRDSIDLNELSTSIDNAQKIVDDLYNRLRIE